jgi:perosamine synthetase
MKKLFRYDCDSPQESITSMLEKDFARLTGSKFAIAMNSCSSALFVSLLCCDIKPGDKVAIPAFTFIAVPSAIVHAHAHPVLIEITKDYVIDINDLEEKFKNNKIKVLLLSYMRGRVPNLDKVRSLCKKYNVSIVEDAAHALGVTWNDKKVGSFGKTGCFSMQSYKMLDGGEGGMLVTNDYEVAAKALLYSGCYEHNWKKHFGTKNIQQYLISITNTLPAFNFRMSNLTAGVIYSQLEEISIRKQIFKRHYTRLVNILKENENIYVPPFEDAVDPVPDSLQFYVTGFSDETLTEAKEYLNNNNVKIERFDKWNSRCFWNWKFFNRTEECETTKSILSCSFDLRLPIDLTSDKIDLLGKQIVDVFR